MRKVTISMLMSILYLFSASIYALNAKGVEIPEVVTQDGSQQELVLNGTGVRGKFIFDIYVGALYLVKPSDDAIQIMSDSSPKRVMMHFLYNEISENKMHSAWREGFEDNLDDVEYAEIEEEIDKFNSAFGDTVKDDVVVIDFLPDSTTRVKINCSQKVIIESPGFQRALLSIWLGDSPIDSSLKSGLLGRQ
ncbi:chalcone isomerase family protein [Thiohalophilus sp.]|uniref:chalcone isomerase family protein n=1 Tax=Thiohalophilus sp. TaxID=3028392 RepID=UPI002ACE85D4|nr:chalcone isomerase family protein [Thiohalophilus sp.]MDZ7805300.1 chalcone isomerase family protein [Thiohalophilus sp.]